MDLIGTELMTFPAGRTRCTFEPERLSVPVSNDAISRLLAAALGFERLTTSRTLPHIPGPRDLGRALKLSVHADAWQAGQILVPCSQCKASSCSGSAGRKRMSLGCLVEQEVSEPFSTAEFPSTTPIGVQTGPIFPLPVMRPECVNECIGDLSFVQSEYR